MFLFDDNLSDLWANANKQPQPNTPTQSHQSLPYQESSGFSNPVNSTWKKKFAWGGPNYSPGQNLLSVNRGDWDYDPLPNYSTRFPTAAEWGDRESDRQALGYYSAAYDPAYTPEYETSYNPYQNTSSSLFYNPFE
jgi:hypothetical protein